MSLLAAVQRFRDAYHARVDLVAGLSRWTKRIALVASDSGESVAVVIRDGIITECVDDSASGDVVITADAQTLRDVLDLKRGPNEPYLFGDLVVRGPEEDFLRLDYITTVLGPA